jgi:hypothetical protein
MRSSAVAAIAGLAVLAAVSISCASASSTKSSATPRCASDGLVVWLNTEGNGAAGSVFYELELTNLSGHACTLFGYPGVSAVNLAGRQLGSAALRSSTTKPKLVKLANRQTAVAVLRIVEVGNYPASTCRPTEAAGLRVYPPNETRPKLVPYPFGACSRKGPKFLSIEVVKKSS